MIIEQIYTGCLAQGAYSIEPEGEAAIIDPLREPKPYLHRLGKSDAKLKFVFETHFHADFVSGHVTLAERTGAEIVFGPGAKTEYSIRNADDAEVFSVGKCTIKALHTPGHTSESTCYLLSDESGKEVALFSGDTLFIGDVGRPDLAAGSTLSSNDLAGMLFDSLREKIMVLSDDIIVYPAHGAGSACGKNMSSETTDTLGRQKTMNYALRSDMTKEELTTELLTGLAEPPNYFKENVRINKEGYADVDQVIENANKALLPEEFLFVAQSTGALIMDTRSPGEFAEGHIPGSVFFGIDGGFAPWVGALVPDVHTPILIVASKGREEEVVTRLARIGFDNSIGYLKGGFSGWRKAGHDCEEVVSVSAVGFKNTENTKILDVRAPGEYEQGHLTEAVNFPLATIGERFAELNPDEAYVVHCKSGYRSMIFCSIAQSRGVGRLVDIKGGYMALEKTGVDITK